MESLDCAVVLCTFNRLPLLKKAIASIRWAVGGLSYVIVVVDGGSSDGSREWLIDQPDVQTIWQELPLTGAVKAYNLGFAHAVGTEAAFVCILNDDDEVIGKNCAIEEAVSMMQADPKIGAVAFETNLRGGWRCEEWHGRPYCNKGIVRRAAGMAAARAAGDPSGCAWWSTDHQTYASDTELGCWIWRLGWTIARGEGLRVKDNAAEISDAMREKNIQDYHKSGTVQLFHKRWDDPRRMEYDLDDALKYGGRIEVATKTRVAKPIQTYRAR